jgi:hypothetical protein
MPSIYFKLHGIAHEIELFPDFAPRTIAKLLAELPASIDIHCAKIAGQHIFWHAPVVADVEKAQDILTLPAGAFLYWPERQFLELIYGELQAEKAQVSVLGQLKGDIEWLRAYGRQVVETHGQGPLVAELLPGEGGDGLAEPESVVYGPGLVALRKARRSMWTAPPAEFLTLLQRQGLMMPYGPLALAEGEFRKLHELIWRLRNERYGIGRAERGRVAGFLIDGFNDRIEGFCGLHACGAVLERAKPLILDPETADVAIEELVLYTGRAAAWLDTYIPWNALNDVTLASLAKSGVR